MRSFTTEEKLAFIREWRTSGKPQEVFCAAQRAQGGPSPRCLRTWIATLGRPEGICNEARAVLARAVEDLRHLVDALDVVRDAQVGAATAYCADAGEATATAAACSRPAGRAARTEPAAAERRPEDAPGEPGSRRRTLLDDITAAVEAAMADADGVVHEDVEHQVAVRPVPFSDPWTRGGGFLGPF
jgi:hypothetical protein